MVLKLSIALAVASVLPAAAAESDAAMYQQLADWSSEFVRYSPATDKCPGGTLAQLQNRMEVSHPLPGSALRERVPAELHAQLHVEDTMHAFWFTTDPDSGQYWGFNGHLVARAGCIIYVSMLGYDN